MGEDESGPGREGNAAIRAFFALDPGAQVREALARRSEALRLLPFGGSVRWVQAENLHLTLRFLGDVEAGRLRALEEAVREAVSSHSGFELDVVGVACFPSKRRPRVVAAEIADHPALSALAGRVEQAVVATGEKPEARPLRPHITLGRLRGKLRGPPPFAGKVTGLGFAVRDVVLYRSELRPSGAVYAELARLPLAADPG